MKYTTEMIHEMLTGAGYFPDKQTEYALMVALECNAPLLVEGAPGTGKTALASAVAKGLSLPLIRAQMYDGVTADRILYRKSARKPTDLSVGWIALFYTFLCIKILFLYNGSLAFSCLLCYNYSMKDNYTRTATTVSLIHYHFVFCPRYRRKIFLIQGVEERFKELTMENCTSHGISILAMECHVDHAHLFLNCLPDQSPADIMKWIKGASSHALRKEFPELIKMPSL